MGEAARRGHVVVCGWSAIARDLVAELTGDDHRHEVVVLHAGGGAGDGPAGDGVSSVRGDAADVVDLARADIRHAREAVICPAETTDRADMRSILAVMAIKSVAPQVRTSVVVNNPARVDHFRRAEDLGVTDLLTMPWSYYGGFKLSLAEKLAGLERFADEVLQHIDAPA